MKQKRCIFHIPFYIEKDRHSGSHIRPIQMLQAFKDIGYEVDEVIGYGKTRKQQINKIKERISQGETYDFLYSESSTMPTLLTEKHHFPSYPTLDFNFFLYCKKNNIPIGLFYRDVYWKFSHYNKEGSLLKRKVAKFFYRYDLKKYTVLLDILYLPSVKMYDYLGIKFNCQIKALPPGANIINTKERDDFFSTKDNIENKKIKIFYVGGIDKDLYNLEGILQAINEVEDVYFTLCTRKNDWEKVKGEYEQYIQPRIHVVHGSGKELIPYYKEADILNLYIKPSEYRDFAMPVKLFEYLPYKKPILSVKGTAAGDFIEKNNIGWSLNYDRKEIVSFLSFIKDNRSELLKKMENIEEILYNHTWDARARQVAKDLSSLGK